ncbi:MAG: hypothetical protein AABO41_24945 [Acidobacteriota bacterium]
MTKQFRLEQVLVDRGAVDGLKDLANSRAGFVDSAGDLAPVAALRVTLLLCWHQIAF